jgi:hypothetical protein
MVKLVGLVGPLSTAWIEFRSKISSCSAAGSDAASSPPAVSSLPTSASRSRTPERLGSIVEVPDFRSSISPPSATSEVSFSPAPIETFANETTLAEASPSGLMTSKSTRPEPVPVISRLYARSIGRR